MRLSPADFWSFSLKEWTAAVDGLIEAQGGTRRASGGVSRAEYEALKRRFPDHRRDDYRGRGRPLMPREAAAVLGAVLGPRAGG